MYSLLIHDISEHKKTKSFIVIATTCHHKYKNVLLNNKCLRHSMNRIESKDHMIGTYEINKIQLSCCEDKIYIQNNGYDGSALD